MKRLGVAVIGTGFWGRNQARVLSELESVSLECVCDVDVATASKVGSMFNVPFSTDLREVLSKKGVDVVTVCTPTVTHKEVAAAAIKAGKHVLVEKPMSSTVAEARELLDLAERMGVRLMPGHIERFNPAVVFLKDLVKKGMVGDIILLLTRRVGQRPERIGDVGVVRDTAIHDVDLARYILEDEVESTYALTGSLKHASEDYAEILLKFRDGETAFIDANWLTPRKIRSLIVTGTRAAARVDFLTQEVSVENAEGVTYPHVEKKEPLKVELAHFADSILNGRPFAVEGIDGLKAVEITEAILRSGSQRQRVSLPLKTNS